MAEQTQANLPALRESDPKQILQRYLTNETTDQIAKSYGVTRQALGQYLLEVDEPGWKAAQIARAIGRKEGAEDIVQRILEEIETADAEKRAKLKLSLAGAEVSLRSAQWELERVCRRIYGQDAPPAVAAVQVIIEIEQDSHQSPHKSNTHAAQVIDVKDSTADCTTDE